MSILNECQEICLVTGTSSTPNEDNNDDGETSALTRLKTNQTVPITSASVKPSTTVDHTSISISASNKGLTAVSASCNVAGDGSTVGPGQPSTPVNLPGVLQDRPHLGRGKQPPPVPPRSPRGGRIGSHGASYSMVQGGVTYLSLPPGPCYSGNPRFARYCSPSIGMTGYNIWHADSLCRLNEDQVLSMHDHHAIEREFPIFEFDPNCLSDGLVLPPQTSPYLENPLNIYHPRKMAKDVWDVIKSVSRPSTPSDTHSFRPSCLSSRSGSFDDSNYDLPDTYINNSKGKNTTLYSNNSPPPPHVKLENDYENITLDKTNASVPFPASHKKDLPNAANIHSYCSNHVSSNSLKCSPPFDGKSSTKFNYMDPKLRHSLAYGSRGWRRSEEMHSNHVLADQNPQSRRSFSGTDATRHYNLHAKRQSLTEVLSRDRMYLDSSLGRYYINSPSPFNFQNSKQPWGGFSDADMNMYYSPVLDRSCTQLAYQSSPALVSLPSPRSRKYPLGVPLQTDLKFSPLARRSFYSEI